MKTIALFLTYLISLNAIAAAPLGVSGQNDTANQYPPVVKVPNNLVTKITGGVLLESGNNNILKNPSFEHSTPKSSWTTSPVVPTLELSDVVHGKQSLSFSPSAEPFEVSQDSTINATAFADGSVQGLAYCRIKIPTTVTADIKFAPRRAGAIVSGLEVSVPKTGKWELVKVPFVLGGTSNGVSVHSAGYAAITASSIKVDDCFVGAVDLKTDSAACGTVDCETVFSAKISATGVVSAESLDWLNGNCTVGAPNVGSFSCPVKAGVRSVPMNCTASMESTGAAWAIEQTQDNGTNILANTYNGDPPVSSAGVWTVHCQKQGADYTSAKAKTGAYYSSTNANYGPVSYTPTVSSASGTITNFTTTASHYRSGKYLRVEAAIAFNGASGTWATPCISLPSGLAGEGLNNANDTTFDLIGRGAIRGASVYYGQIYYDWGSNKACLTTDAVTTHTGTAPVLEASVSSTFPVTLSSGHSLKFSFELPIQGWENSNVIIGNFAGHYFNSPTVLNEGTNGRNSIDVGTWTPGNTGTNTNVTSLDFSTAYGIHKYMRVGNMLFVSGRFAHNVAVVTNWSYAMTLPSFVVNNFTTESDCSGTMVGESSGAGTLRSGAIKAETNRIRFTSGSSDTGGLVVLSYHAMCIVR